MSEQMATAQAQLEDAQRQKAEADDLIRALERRVHDGDVEVTAIEMGEQYGVQRLAALQQQRADRLVAEAEAADLARRRQEAEEAARRELEAVSPEVLADACEAALLALERVHALGAERQAVLRRHAQTYLSLGMTDKVRHQEGSWIVYEAGGAVYDTHQDPYRPDVLLSLVEGERTRRTRIAARLAKGFPAPDPAPHPMARLLAERTSANMNAEVA